MMDNCEEHEGAAALMDEEKRCPQCDFVNLAEAELCISCAQELPSKEETKNQLLHKRNNLSCRFCTTIMTEDCRICPMCSKSRDLPLDRVLKKKYVEEKQSCLADDRHTISCKFCTSKIKEDSRICPICSKSQDLPKEGAQRKDTDDWFTDDEDECSECTYKTKASICEMCGKVLRKKPGYVERNCMAERDKPPTEPGHKDDQREHNQIKEIFGGFLTFCKKVYEEPCMMF